MKYLSLFYLFFLFSALIQPLNAQKKKKKDEAESFYLVNKDWTAAPNFAAATYFMQVLKENDSTYICRYYNKFGPMARQESFKDSALSIPNGLFYWYNSDGYLDSSGEVEHGYKDGYWTYYRQGKEHLSIKYQNRKIVEKTDVDADVYMDSTGATFSLKEKLWNDSLRRDSVMRARDSTKPVQQEAKFEGNWNKYLERTVITPQRLVNVMPRGRYTVTVSFLVNQLGKIEEVTLIKSCEWSADAEVLRVFKNAPDWIPAQQNGHPVIYRQKQSLSFEVIEQ